MRTIWETGDGESPRQDPCDQFVGGAVATDLGSRLSWGSRGGREVLWSVFHLRCHIKLSVSGHC